MSNDKNHPFVNDNRYRRYSWIFTITVLVLMLCTSNENVLVKIVNQYSAPTHPQMLANCVTLAFVVQLLLLTVVNH